MVIFDNKNDKHIINNNFSNANTKHTKIITKNASPAEEVLITETKKPEFRFVNL